MSLSEINLQDSFSYKIFRTPSKFLEGLESSINIGENYSEPIQKWGVFKVVLQNCKKS
jgi:hypothetical protein